MLWSGIKTVGRETLLTGGKILTDLADTMAGDVKTQHIIAKHVSDSAQTNIQKLRGSGRKRDASLKSRGVPPKKKARTKAAKTTKGTTSHSPYHSITDHGRGHSVSKHRVRRMCY